MAIEAWFVDETSGEDQRLPRHCNPKEFVSHDYLAELGVLYWRLNPANYENDEELKKIREDRGYNYMDLLDICPEKVADFKEKLKNFYTEHIHADEEIRYCLEGSAYFDVRDKDDRWIRIWIKAGDLIILPAGIYHRFTLDTGDYVKLMRLFVGEPVWTAYNRPQEDHPARKEYIKSMVTEKDPREEVIQAWYMDDSDEDQRLPHHREPKEFVSLDQLAELGVLSWKLDADNHETDAELKKIREERGYSYVFINHFRNNWETVLYNQKSDIVNMTLSNMHKRNKFNQIRPFLQDLIEVCPEKLPNYEEKIKSFFEEHLHTDEEIRYCLGGSGYFDVRDHKDHWIRVWVKKGGMIVLPAGIYHRFTLDADNYIKAMRLFVGDPVWTPFNRPHDHLPARKEYVQAFVNKDDSARAVDAAA
ncbi:hypothetical protein H0E87_015523 [Populus deltoides]|uniref:Acireductone dioxygenase n=1 Tax=Populus deltoides TaxID=3696 RepID=A0A8T2Y599_POPDE|nr:hypothetical protein H0E87_015523 [Populus deltoides]